MRTIVATAVIAATLMSSSAWAQARKRVAVSKFDAHGAFVAAYGGWDIGGGLAAQFVTELARTGRFIIVERADLAGALREQELGLARITTAESAPAAGQVLGAQLLVRGTVTEFDQAATGKNVQVGFGLLGRNLGIGMKHVKGRVAIDLRLIDATTGEVVDSHRAEAEAIDKGLTAGLQDAAMTIGSQAFDRTALGKATREVIARAVTHLVKRADQVAWTGRIVDVGEGVIYINGGADVDLHPGQRLTVSALARELVDPASGARLGAVEEAVGELEIWEVHERFSIARAVTRMRAQRGQLVRLAGALHDAASGKAGAASGERTAQGPTPESLRQAIQDLQAQNMSNPPVFPIPSAPMLGGGDAGFPSPIAAAPPAAPPNFPRQ